MSCHAGALTALAMFAQAGALRRVVGVFIIALLALEKDCLHDIAAFGAFSWLQAIAGIAFNYVLIGSLLDS